MIFLLILSLALMGHAIYASDEEVIPYEPNIPINEAALKIRGHILSCTRPRHLVVANKEIDQFRKAYANHPNKDIYLNILCGAAQVARVNVKFKITKLA